MRLDQFHQFLFIAPTGRADDCLVLAPGQRRFIGIKGIDPDEHLETVVKPHQHLEQQVVARGARDDLVDALAFAQFLIALDPVAVESAKLAAEALQLGQDRPR